jgi:molybdopterin molybdotransferase
VKNWDHECFTRIETLERIIDASVFTPHMEVVDIRDALLRVSADDIYSANTLPNCPSSFRDGICVRFGEFEGGMPDTSRWVEGEDYAYCNTGFGIPWGFDTVIMIEDVEMAPGGGIVLSKVPEKGQFVNPPGCNLQEDDLLVKSHTCLYPQHLGLIASGGHTEVEVFKRPKVQIIPTGNELVEAGVQPVPRGRNVESNSVMMAAQLSMMGAEPHVHDIICDDPEKIEAAIRDALTWADIIITNGGTSKGTGDWAATVFERLGRILVREVDYGPGKHTMMAVAGDTPIVGAVGPSIGAECAMEWYVRPLIAKYYGIEPVTPPTLQVRLTDDIPIPVSAASGKKISVYRWFALKKTPEGYDAVPVSPSAGRSACSLAPVYVSVPKETGGYQSGEIVTATLRFPIEWVDIPVGGS